MLAAQFREWEAVAGGILIILAGYFYLSIKDLKRS
jgi:hypothetical protein